MQTTQIMVQVLNTYRYVKIHERKQEEKRRVQQSPPRQIPQLTMLSTAAIYPYLSMGKQL